MSQDCFQLNRWVKSAIWQFCLERGSCGNKLYNLHPVLTDVQTHRCPNMKPARVKIYFNLNDLYSYSAASFLFCWWFYFALQSQKHMHFNQDFYSVQLLPKPKLRSSKLKISGIKNVVTANMTSAPVTVSKSFYSGRNLVSKVFPWHIISSSSLKPRGSWWPDPHEVDNQKALMSLYTCDSVFTQASTHCWIVSL